MATSYTRPVDVPAGINKGLTSAGNQAMLALLGNPRSNYSTVCKPVTHSALKKRIRTVDVGCFRVTGLDCAVEDLGAILREIKSAQPELYKLLGTAGMLCCRLVRGSRSSISNHSWGTAIDLTIGGQLQPLGRARVQYGLALMAPIFNAHRWWWGAGFTRCDGMHFEASRQLVQTWTRDLPDSTLPVADGLSLGDRSPQVADLQRALNKVAHEDLKVDGIFGQGTRAAVIAFQAVNALKADGIAGVDTMTLLNA
jgi:hypothetical protein